MKQKTGPGKTGAERSEKPSAASRISAWLRKNRLALPLFFLCLAIFLGLLFTANRGRIFDEKSPEEYETETSVVTVERAKVLNISKDTVSPNRENPDGRASGVQTLLVRLLTGSHKGQTLQIDAHFVGVYTNERIAPDDEITVLQSVDKATGAATLLARNYDRSAGVYLVLALFLAAVLAVGGRTGLKSLLGLAFTVVALIWIFCPMWMKGAKPVPLAFGLCVLVSVMSFLILGGTSKKILAAVLGTAAGMGLATLFSLLAQAILRIDSYALYDADSNFAQLVNLQGAGYPLHVEGILTAGIVIAALGAVMDVAMSLSSSISELKTVNPELKTRELWRSGMRIGRDMVGTMTNTLILAFVGGSLVLVILLWSQGPSYQALLSSRYFSVELITALSSSVGVILAVPLTALIGALLFGRAAPERGTEPKTK